MPRSEKGNGRNASKGLKRERYNLKKQNRY